MSRFFMLVIALLYLGASLSFLIERKWLWALVATSWAIGNLALAYLAINDQKSIL